MNSNPKISVIIPVYNPGKYFYKCLDSIVNQTYRNLEIILIDDGSSDGSEMVCDEYKKKDARVKVIHQINSGVSCARNVGLENATGDFINFPDSDDYIDYNTYEVLLHEINKNHAEAVCFEYNVTYKDKEVRHKDSNNRYGVFDTQEAIHELLFSNRSFLCSKLLPMYSVKNLKFIENIYRDEDTIFCMMALHNVKRTVFIDNPMYHYVQSEESACRGVFRSNQISAIDAISIMERFLGSYYPGMLNKWRCNYMHLMIMLYMDMYFDEKNYLLEQQRVYSSFIYLYNNISFYDIASIKNAFKFLVFRNCPGLFVIIHKIAH